LKYQELETGMRKFMTLAIIIASTLPVLAGSFEDGASAFKRGDYGAAINRWRPLAASDPTIQNNYGIMYKDGKGVKRDYAVAAQWFSRSASAGSSLGQNNLGGLYRDGMGVQRDYPKAVTFFQAAAQQGNPAAQVNLGLMQMNGQGTRPDPVHAYMWFDVAASQGMNQAVVNRNNMRQRMNSRDLAQATQLSARCRQQNYKSCG
jgi:TPR repeat protein